MILAEKPKQLDKTIVAVFDFDYTLYHCWTGFCFTRYLFGIGALLRYTMRNPCKVARYITNIKDEVVLQHYSKAMFRGKDKAYLLTQAKSFFSDDIQHKQKHFVFDRLLEHQKQGHQCVIISRTYEFLLQAWSEAYQPIHYIGTKVEIDSAGRLTGNLVGKSPFKKQKVRLLQQHLPLHRDNYFIHAYSDSMDDRPLLEYADIGNWVKKYSIKAFH